MRATKFIILIMIAFTLLFVPCNAKNSGYRLVYSGKVTMTAYNSLENQTDSTPWITAAGTRCREGVIASNFLPMGTKVMIEGFGDRMFVVEDRMNRRYKNRIDIWFRSYGDAIKFGRRTLKFYVVEEVKPAKLNLASLFNI